jgi:hypothetical protein
LGQDSRASAEAQQSSDEAYWLARACRSQCAELSKDHDHLAAAYILGLMVRCGAVDASGTLAQVAKRAAFLTVLLGLPQVLHDTLIELATSNAAAPFEQWPRLIANAIYESEIKPSKNEVAA